MRNYQKNFYANSYKVRDENSRIDKALKITEVLNLYSKVDLSSGLCLDLGCASGIVTNKLSPMFRQMIGLEFDSIALKNISQSDIAGPIFVQGDAMSLPFQANQFDVIICSQVYEHVPDDTKLVAEIFRTLKPGGTAFFSGPNKLFPIEPHYFLPFLHWLPQNIANRYLRLFKKGDQYYERSRTMWSLKKLLRSFIITDVSVQVLSNKVKANKFPVLGGFLQFFVHYFWRLLLPFLPNYNWLLQKPVQEN